MWCASDALAAAAHPPPSSLGVHWRSTLSLSSVGNFFDRRLLIGDTTFNAIALRILTSKTRIFDLRWQELIGIGRSPSISGVCRGNEHHRHGVRGRANPRGRKARG